MVHTKKNENENETMKNDFPLEMKRRREMKKKLFY